MSHDKPFWSKKWGNDAICPISQTRLGPGKDAKNNPYVRTLICGHRFWRKSINAWIIFKL